MRSVNIPENKDDRLKKLQEYKISDPLPEEVYNNFTFLASQICKTPISLISFIDSKKQWFKAGIGLGATETPRPVAFEAYAILDNKVFIVEDSYNDERFADNSLVRGDPYIRFYAGAQLLASTGLSLGILSVIDRVPRQLSQEMIKALEIMSRQIVSILELRIDHNKLEQFEILFSSMSEGMVIQSQSGEIFQSNAAALRILGLSIEELRGRSSLDAHWHAIDEEGNTIPGSAHPAMVCLETGQNQYNKIMGVYRKGGDLVWILVNASPIFRDGHCEPHQAICTFLDITEKKKKEDELKMGAREVLLQKKKFEDFIFALNESAIVAATDLAGVITFVNNKFCEISGYKAWELLGNTHAFMNSKVHPKSFHENLWKTISSNKIWRGEICNRTKSNECYWVDTTIVPLLNSNGVLSQYMSIGFDITATKRLEDKLKASQSAEKQANQAKSIFLANMSHEIRTPMNAIIGLTEVLLSQKDLDADKIAHLEVIDRSANHLLSIINNILDLSKIEAGQIEFENISVSLEEILESIVEVVSPLARQKKIHLKMSVSQACHGKYLGDPLRIKQILINLTNNAIKFTPFGEVNISIESSSSAKGGVIFNVQDTGIGIKPEKISELFKEFSQAEVSTTRKYGGTGLGLAICKRIVNAMGGEIQVESREGVGSTFTVQLPLLRQVEFYDPTANAQLKIKALKEGAVDAATKNESDIPVPDRHEKVIRQPSLLIVDDNDDNRTVIRAFLRNSKFDLTECSNGDDAIVQIKMKHFDIIFLDIQMPEKDGFCVLKEIQEIQLSNPDKREMKVIALTANAMDEDRIRCISAGFNDHLAKPIKLKTLLDAIKKHSKRPEVKNVADSEIDFDTIEFLKSLDPDGWDTFKKLVDSFSKNTPVRLEKMRKAVEMGDGDLIRHEAHQLISICGNLGAMRLSEIAVGLESLGKKGLFPEVNEAIAEFESHFNFVKNVLLSKMTAPG